MEVGWAFAEGEAKSLLIRPDAAWSMEAWDPAAQAMHNLTVEKVLTEGAAIDQVCETLSSALAGCAVYSDAPDWDAFWLQRLYSAGKRRPGFGLKEFARLMPPVGAGMKAQIIRQADEIAPRRHRAGDDAGHLQALYRFGVSLA